MGSNGLRGANPSASTEEMFCVKSEVQRGVVKNRILKSHLLPYICRDCGNTGEWRGKKITLQIEHINGVSDDHRLENLCFLCPNCHSQTESFAGKSAWKIIPRKARRTRAEAILKRMEDSDILYTETIARVLESDIDFSRYGWVQKVSAIVGISPQKIRKWMKRHLPDIEARSFRKLKPTK